MLRERLLSQAKLLAAIRRFFAQRQVAEVITPVLSQAAGTDPALEPMRSQFTGPGFARGLSLYLQTSPEFAMKRLLAAGSGDIFQICQAFRDGEYGALHNPEFTLLEWYRLGFDHHQLMDEMAALVAFSLGQEISFEKISYCELFEDCFSWSPLEVTGAQLKASAQEHAIQMGQSDAFGSRDEGLDLLLSHVIQPQLGQGCLTFVYDYPASQASLARLNEQDNRIASRFELYYQGVELANGFHELADSEEQRQRFAAENRQRAVHGQALMPLDENLLSALDSLPDCAGVALGLDRLFMLKSGFQSLGQSMNFPLPRA